MQNENSFKKRNVIRIATHKKRRLIMCRKEIVPLRKKEFTGLRFAFGNLALPDQPNQFSCFFSLLLKLYMFTHTKRQKGKKIDNHTTAARGQ